MSALVAGIEVYAASTLREVVEFLGGVGKLPRATAFEAPELEHPYADLQIGICSLRTALQRAPAAASATRLITAA